MNHTTEYEKLIEILNHPINNVPIEPSNELYYPNYVKKKLNDWTEYYSEFIRPAMASINPGSVESDEDLSERLKQLKNGILDTLQLYYEGKVLKATNKFNSVLDTLFYPLLKPVDSIAQGTSFYRARVDDHKGFKRQDLFHCPFEDRHKLGTNRYSVPGLPALYLGGSTYVCWEEFQRHRFRDLYYSRLINNNTLNVIKIIRMADLLKDLEGKSPMDALPYIWRYILLFPITIASCICVKYREGKFKPEYIISQLLLQFVAEETELDGIMYPSTNVDYSKLTNVPAYNYVFPVKTVLEQGFCPILKEKFSITEPTSLELDELLFNTDEAMSDTYPNPSKVDRTPRALRFFEGTIQGYHFTSFGLIEKRLKQRPLKEL